MLDADNLLAVYNYSVLSKISWRPVLSVKETMPSVLV
jgi:hypothetical protein